MTNLSAKLSKMCWKRHTNLRIASAIRSSEVAEVISTPTQQARNHSISEEGARNELDSHLGVKQLVFNRKCRVFLKWAVENSLQCWGMIRTSHERSCSRENIWKCFRTSCQTWWPSWKTPTRSTKVNFLRRYSWKKLRRGLNGNN